MTPHTHTHTYIPKPSPPLTVWAQLATHTQSYTLNPTLPPSTPGDTRPNAELEELAQGTDLLLLQVWKIIQPNCC